VDTFVYLILGVAGESIEQPKVHMSDVVIQARGLLDFIEQSIEEAMQRPETLAECLIEADHARDILKKMVRADDMLFVRLAASNIFDVRFSGAAGDTSDAERYLEIIAATKATIFC